MGPTPVCVYPVLTAEDPHLAPIGEIICCSSVQDHIDTLAFTVVNTNESGTVDLSRATVTVMAGDFIEVLTRSKDSSPGPGTWRPSLPGDNDGAIPLAAGEECTIQILLDRPIPAGTTLTVRVRLPGALPCPVTGVSGDDVAPGIGVSSSPEY